MPVRSIGRVYVDCSTRYPEKLRRPNETDVASRGASQSVKLDDKPKFELFRIEDYLMYELSIIICSTLFTPKLRLQWKLDPRTSHMLLFRYVITLPVIPMRGEPGRVIKGRFTRRD